MSTTYVGTSDLNTALEGFVDAYYGTHLDGGEDLTISDQFYEDMQTSFDKSNELLSGIGHIKTIPVGTQSTGRYPMAVRQMQANFMIYQRLISKHYGEISGEIPGWINVYRTRAMEFYSDIKGQDAVFTDDVSQGESGIGIGSWVTHTGSARIYTNYSAGFYWGADYPRVYVVVIDATSAGTLIGQSTFKWSNDHGLSYAITGVTTSTSWISLENGLSVRWEPFVSGTVVGTLDCQIGDRYDILCIPQNVPVKSGNIRFTTFKRG
jgi:hypothetical protein